eukprot:TRINITY_DN54439_c0_g1_i1.p1 TRINITY_DN54439_c0_g1~~TRINITY_DN54439_c0_g1_i1.p1  ORF type:complete len:149 (+),score=17.92 TRINITY_DN54439_c0_g1_i1:102-548(+)
MCIRDSFFDIHEFKLVLNQVTTKLYIYTLRQNTLLPHQIVTILRTHCACQFRNLLLCCRWLPGRCIKPPATCTSPLSAGAGFSDSCLEDARAAVSYTHLRAHETPEHLVCRLLLEKKKKKIKNVKIKHVLKIITQQTKIGECKKTKVD